MTRPAARPATRPAALIVDDEPDIRELIAMTLRRMDLEVVAAEDLAAARQQLRQRGFNVCFTDLRLPDGHGTELVEYIQAHHPQLPVAVITAHGDMQTAVTALKHGAFDFVSKPLDLKVLRNLVETALRLSTDLDQDSDRNGATATDTTAQLLGGSPTIEAIRATIRKLARSQAPVYISGESGTGKELVARLIHSNGPRVDQPFVPVNCGAIPAELMESEFFGHRKGSFTGADRDKVGLFQAAQGGTLFLDEVADLPLPMQVKLLRAIQEKAVRRIGDTREAVIDVRILSATHKDLAVAVEQGDFRRDLYYRINVIELKVPPLREHCADVPLLVGHILARLARDHGLPRPEITNDAMAELASYGFPGNVRELENTLERAMTLCEQDTIRARDLGLTETFANAVPSDAMPLTPYLDSVEKQAITQALDRTGGNKTAAAKELGLTFRALRYRLKKLGME